MKKKVKLLSPNGVSILEVPAETNQTGSTKKNGTDGNGNNIAKAKQKSNSSRTSQKNNGSPSKSNGRSTISASSSDDLDMRELLKVLSEMRHGNFGVRMPIDKVGLGGKICDTLNEILLLNEALVEELTQARNTIGKQGHLNHRVSLPKYAKGSWSTASDSINSLISDLVHPTI